MDMDLYLDNDEIRVAKFVAVAVLLLSMVSLLLVISVYYAGVGETVLIMDPFSKTISDPISGPVIGLKFPWQGAVVIYTAVDSVSMWGTEEDITSEYPSVDCFSRDQLEMKIDVMVRWQLDKGKIKKLYENYPRLNWHDTIASIVRERLRLLTKEWSAIQTIEQRDIVRQMMADEVKRSLSNEPSLAGAIINIEFELRNIAYPDAYTKAIEEKLAAEQAKIKADYEAQRIITLANAEAEKLLIAANATAQQKIIDAIGIQKAIQTLLGNASLNEENYARLLNTYITLKALEQIASNEGVYFFVGTDGQLLIQPKMP